MEWMSMLLGTVEQWVCAMLSQMDNPQPQSQTHASRSSHAYNLGRYVLQLKGWRRGIFELAYSVTAFRLSELTALRYWLSSIPTFLTHK